MECFIEIYLFEKPSNSLTLSFYSLLYFYVSWTFIICHEIGCLSFLVLDPYVTKLDFSLLITALFIELFDHFVYYFQPYMISLEAHKKLVK